jgi:hypothetical protein
MSQSEHGRNRCAIFSGQSDVNFVAHALNQVSKPQSRLGYQVMAPSRHEQKPVEFIYQVLRPAYFIGKSFFLCPSDLSLNAILVQTSEKLLQTGL